jgi:hypothetical protein
MKALRARFIPFANLRSFATFARNPFNKVSEQTGNRGIT